MLWMWYEERVQIHTLTCGNPVAPAPFAQKTIGKLDFENCLLVNHTEAGH